MGPDEAPFGASLRWSPDASRIAYVRGPGQGEGLLYGDELLVARLDGEEYQVFRSDWTSSPTWSLDGSVLYVAVGEDRTDIWAIDPSAGPNRIIDSCRQPIAGPMQLSPDGSFLVETCPDAPELHPIESSDPREGLPLPSEAVRIDVQRIAP
jgi:tricorn protease-like protein